MDEPKPARALGPNDLPFEKTTREVMVEKTVKTSDYIIDQDEGADIIANHIRQKFNLDTSYEIKVSFYNTERTDDLCNAVITQNLD